jgi:hypothetical protein
MMYSKEKAFEIFDKCCDYADYTDEDCCFTERETMYKNARALSFIMIDEILNNTYCQFKTKYWQEVKKEIENIEICDNNLLKLPKKYTEKHILDFAEFLEKYQGGTSNRKVLKEIFEKFK